MNKVLLVGYVGKKPETTVYGNDKKVTKFSVATTEYYSKDSKETSWHNIVIWGQYGETMGNLINVGHLVSIEGRLAYSPYEKDGVKCISTSINVDKINILDKRDSNDSSSNEPTQNYTPTNTQSVTTQNATPQYTSNTGVDDLPF